MEKFHISTWQDKTKLKEGFEDGRYRELASRIIALEKPDLLSDEEYENFSQFINERLFSKGPWLNLSQAIQKLEKFDSDDSDLVNIKKALEEHLQNLEKANSA
jgi:exonuclease I